MTACIEVEDLWKSYGATTALSGVSLQACGGLNVVVGPNGSGKSTLLRIIAGLARPTRGRVWVDGRDPWRERPHLLSGSVRVAFESMSLPWWMSGYDIIRHYAAEKNLDPREPTRLARHLGLGEEALNMRVRAYSMGMRKKLLLALALTGGARLYLLDEPYTLLDAATVEKLDAILRERAREATVVVASHVATPTLEEADKLIALAGGRLVAAMERKAPARSYKCRGRSLINKLLEEHGIQRIMIEGDEIRVEAGEAILPPAPGCEPVLPLKTIMEELLSPPTS